MNIIYLISAVVIFKLIVYFTKRINVNVREINNSYDKTDLTSEIKLSTENTKELGKNKWLYPDDEFVKHKNPKHHKSKNYKF